MALISGIYGNNVYALPKKKVGKKRPKHTCKVNQVLAAYRRELVEKATPAEIAFQHILTDLRISFEFQKEMKRRGRHVAFADFYLPVFHLVVEIDGGYHTDPVQQWKDEKRTKEIVKKNKKAQRVLRFTNHQILSDKEGVKSLLCKRLSQTKNRSQLSQWARNYA